MKGKWKIKGETLPQDLQDALNEAMDTHVNQDGKTLREAMEEAGKDVGWKEEGYYRDVPTMQDQLQDLWDYKYIYCNNENYLFWAASNGVEVDDEDQPELRGMIPLSICGVKGNEFEEFNGRKKIEISYNMVKLINGEEKDILLGCLKGDGSEILYS